MSVPKSNLEVGGFIMSNYIITNIKKMFSIITGIDNQDELLQILKQSNIYDEITKNNEAYLYEGVNANVLDIANELIEKDIRPDLMKKITPETIRIINRTRKLYARKKLDVHPEETSILANIEYIPSRKLQSTNTVLSYTNQWNLSQQEHPYISLQAPTLPIRKKSTPITNQTAQKNL